MKTNRVMHPFWSGLLAITLLVVACPSLAQEAEPPPAEQAPPPSEEAPLPEEEGTTMSSPPTSELQTSAPSANPAGNVLNFQADLFTGRFSYSIPIVVAPARQGSQPNIALSYNSQGGNGWCGVGWMLDMGFIERETRNGVPRKWTGVSPTNEYDNAYGFVFYFQGVNSKLVDTGGNVYRSEVDGTFLKFNYVTNSPNNFWQVIDKAGNQFFFGEATTNRMENTKFPAGKPSSTYRWALNRVLDVNGNTTFLNYTTHSNQLYLSKITYNGHTNSITGTNTVDFILESAERPDRTTSFLPGYRVETRKRLQAIEVKVGTQQVRKYVVAYTNSPSTSRSLLASVTQHGSDFSTSLPPMRFTYQVQQFGFNTTNNWTGLYSQGQTGQNWNAIRSRNTAVEYRTELLDMDRDGLPDRVMKRVSSPWTNWFALQFNTGTNFYPSTTNYTFAPLDSQGNTGEDWNSVRTIKSGPQTVNDLVDIDGDLLPDRVMRKMSSPYTNFVVQFSKGYPANDSFTLGQNWGPVTNEASSDDWRAVRAGNNVYVDLIDMNGDGLPDRVAREDIAGGCDPCTNPYDRFKVQLNNGGGFGPLLDWMTLLSQGQTNDPQWNSIYGKDINDFTMVGLYDLNGDTLPDRVMRKLTSPYSNLIVQFNNGAGFEAAEENWGPLDLQGCPLQEGDPCEGWGGPVGTSTAGDVFNTLADVNGDGLVDRVMRRISSPYTNLVVQLNTGSGFITNGIN